MNELIKRAPIFKVSAGVISPIVSATSLDLGAATVIAAKVTIEGTSWSTFTRSTAVTNAQLTTFRFITKSTGNMADGFGGVMHGCIMDNAGVENIIADFGWIRDGADNSGRMRIGVSNAGTFIWPFNIRRTGNIAIGSGFESPTAILHIKAGTETAQTAPLKFTTGTVNTTAEAGAMEYNNTPHFTNSDATRRHIVLAPNTTKVTAAAPYTNDGYVVLNIGGTDFKVMTTA